MPDNFVTNHTEALPGVLSIAIYSDRAQLREEVRSACGSTLAPDLPPVEIVEFATGPALIRALHNGDIHLCILDGEAAPLGGMGLSYQIKSEVPNTPPLLVLLQRRDDAWLATWSRADGVYPLPVDPLTLPQTVANLIRTHGVPASEAATK